jgi:cysteine desulfurase family protein
MIYLDHAATSWPKPRAVGEEIARWLTELTANAGRSGHQASLASARLVFQTRERLAELLGVAHSEDLIFTHGATEGLNLVLKGLLTPGDRVLVSPLEHNAVMRPLATLVRERHITLQTLPADPWGRIDLEATRRVVRSGPYALAVVAHSSNVSGAVQDLAGLHDALNHTPLLVDAAQTAGVLPISIESAGIDFLACSVHKGLLGPSGLGLCYLSPRYDLLPLVEGGTGSHSESFEQPGFRPDRYESGTLNLHGIAGTCGALQDLTQRGLLGEHQQHLCQLLIDGLATVPGLRLHSPADGTALCVSLNLAEMPPESLALRLEREFGILCRPGLHCAPAAHQHLGTFPAGTVRLSPGWGNTIQDMETAIRAIHALATNG